MQKSLKGKVALITGGSRGLGAAMAEAFANHGADVAISYAASADLSTAKPLVNSVLPRRPPWRLHHG